jgi:uncharacterized protein YgiM (DUF1202 family)
VYKRLTVVTLALIGLVVMAYAIAPRRAAAAGQPTPQPSQAPPPAPLATLEPRQAPTETRCTVTAEALNIRTCPGASCAVIGWLQAGQRVNVLADYTPGGWAELQPSGGWIHSSFINCEAKP